MSWLQSHLNGGSFEREKPGGQGQKETLIIIYAIILIFF